MFNWLSESLTRKIGGLSTILLSFILVVILYSIFKLEEIGREIREVAEVDIPLTEVISEIEIVQLEQHILFEQIRFTGIGGGEDAKQQSTIAEFKALASQSDELVKAAFALIQSGIQSGVISQKIQQHEDVLSHIGRFQKARQTFQREVLETLQEAQGTPPVKQWGSLEKQSQALDTQAIALLHDIETLTEEIARNAEKHEREFMMVNAALGISALFIGLYVTFYIIRSFRRRIGQIQGRIDTLHDSMDGNLPMKFANEDIDGKDELSELASDINRVMGRFSAELDNRDEVEKALMQLAITDKLTGAFNRHKWDEALLVEQGHGNRNTPIGLLMLDIDFFKKINDEHGHDIGDLVLKSVVQLIRSNIRQSDQVFRLGGEEFAMLFRHYDAQKTSLIAEKLRRIFARHEQDGLPKFTASFGVTDFRPGEPLQDFVKRADEALYQSKHSGRNKVTRR